MASSLFAGALAAFALGSGGAGAASSTTLNPDADTYVDSSNPSTNYGSRDLRVDGSPTVNSYLRFTVPDAAGAVVSAQLQIYAKSSQSTGFTVSTVASNTWTETGTTWSNAPAIGSALGSTGGPITAGNWYSVDVTGAVPGPGTYSFALTTPGSTALALGSKETASPVVPPQLVVNSSGSTSSTVANSSTTVTTAPASTTTHAPTTTTQAPTTTTGAPTTTTTIPSGGGGDPVIAAAGDIACDPTSSNFNNGSGTSSSCREMATSDLIVGHGYTAVLVLGDNQYYCGGLAGYQQSYDPSWGRVKSITHPSVGNHEYLTSGGTGCDSSNAGAAGYFNYFGSAAGTKGSGYYSYNIGSWHLIALNTNCGDAGGCSPSSPQGQWLAADLANNTQPCTLAYMHIPLFSSGGRANQNSKTFWDQLYAAHADVVLTGHDHTYERFAPMTPSGSASSAGLREFVVGTGGANHTSFASAAPNSQIFNQDTFGILAMTLSPTSYTWSFVHEPGKTFTDSGTTACHNAGSLAAMKAFGAN